MGLVQKDFLHEGVYGGIGIQLGALHHGQHAAGHTNTLAVVDVVVHVGTGHMLPVGGADLDKIGTHVFRDFGVIHDGHLHVFALAEHGYVEGGRCVGLCHALGYDFGIDICCAIRNSLRGGICRDLGVCQHIKGEPSRGHRLGSRLVGQGGKGQLAGFPRGVDSDRIHIRVVGLVGIMGTLGGLHAGCFGAQKDQHTQHHRQDQHHRNRGHGQAGHDDPAAATGGAGFHLELCQLFRAVCHVGFFQKGGIYVTQQQG